MKSYLLLSAIVLLLPLLSNSQCNYTQNEVDEFTGSSILSMKAKKIATGLYVWGVRQDKVCYLLLSAYSDIGCATKESTVMVKFKDKSIQKFTNLSKLDCKDGAALTIKIDIDELSDKKISLIRITKNDGQEDYYINKPNYFASVHECLTLK